MKVKVKSKNSSVIHNKLLGTQSAKPAEAETGLGWDMLLKRPGLNQEASFLHFFLSFTSPLSSFSVMLP